ncbi:hypothetical protein IKX64_01870 [Candidatus Saccharibacteria bacterium]|nr:hypothetical protein [Candidatus Saccharibacteria bacterium]
MKKSLGLKICASLLAVPILGTFCRGAFAVTNSTLKVGSEDIFTATGSESNAEETATYDSTTKTLTLKGYKGKAIDTDIASLTINVTEASTVTDTVKTLHSTGNITITGKKLTLSNGLDVDGGFILESGEVDLGTTDLTAKGTIKINGAIKAGSIVLTAESPAKAKIMLNEKADVAVTKYINANYSTKATVKGIELNKVCANAKIINIDGTGKTASTTTVFSSDEKTGVTNGVKISSALCETSKDEEKKEEKKNPDTADSIYFYVAALVASSAIFVYRRHLAKR